MMYIAEIDLKKKKRQLIPLTRICLFGYVEILFYIINHQIH